LAVVACRDALDGVADGDQRSSDPLRREAGQEIGGDEGNAESQSAAPKQPIQALHGFRRADIHADRSHRLIARIADRRVRGEPKSPLIAHKFLVGLKLIEVDKVIGV
jgi:hypothetical protein